MINLLTTGPGNTQQSTCSDLESTESEELKVNPILKKLAPEKQPISSDELVHLVEADQLSQSESDSVPAKPEEEDTVTVSAGTESENTSPL
jgi:hypothetical protein